MKTPTRQEYINQLVSCGFAPHRAMRYVYDFLKDFTEEDLRLFIKTIEKDSFNVD